jgi:NADH-quinone oxidoreductase subunit H
MSDQPAVRRPATPMLQQIAEHRSLVQRARSLRWEWKFLGLVVLAILAAPAVAIGFLVVTGRLDGEWYDVRDLGLAVGELRVWMQDQGWHPAIPYLTTAIIGATGILVVVGGWLLIGSWIERRALARFQIRQGPNRTGPFGLLQPLADALKLMQKESVIPRGADKFLYLIPPVFIFIPAILGWAPIPWAPNMTYLDINVGVLYVVAISSLGVLAVFIAGWSSNNHYSLLGAMRTVAMMVSYEIPISIALLSVVLLTGSLQLSEIVAWQADHHFWLIVLLPFAAFTFLFASTAEINRTPNDIGEAESEIVAGFYTEYSGMKAGLFMAVELGHAILVGALLATFFLGGYTLFGLEQWIPGYVILLAKFLGVYLLFVWIRGTLPRFRLDQLMGYAWKFLIPLSVAQVFVAAIGASIIARVDAPSLPVLGGFALVNLVIMAVMVRSWARALGYAPEFSEVGPVLATSIGGLKAAERMRSAS